MCRRENSKDTKDNVRFVQKANMKTIILELNGYLSVRRSNKPKQYVQELRNRGDQYRLVAMFDGDYVGKIKRFGAKDFIKAVSSRNIFDEELLKFFINT